MSFQWKYYMMVPHVEPPIVLNIGSANDPLEFGSYAMHFDIDDWTAEHKWFTQGDAHKLPFPDRSYQLVVLGDIMEHVVDPMKVTDEALRVTAVGGYMVATIFEEWRLSGPGQHIEEGTLSARKHSQLLGYADEEDYQAKVNATRIGFSNDELPHLFHINQFVDSDIEGMISWALRNGDVKLVEAVKAFEVTHDGHDIYNWLVAFQRLD
jgi:SAM-dependent methyltransferase